MLKRDMLITLHVRIRIVATHELKLSVRLAKDRSQARNVAGRKERGHSRLRQELEVEDLDGSGISPQSATGIAWLSLSPKSARRYSRRLPSNDSGSSTRGERPMRDADHEQVQGDGDEYESDNEEDVEWDIAEDHLWPSMISDPGRATPLQRRWLSAMSEGKDPYIAWRFEQ
jgi:hypothetical protein